MKSKKLGILRKELNQFLGRYLIEGLHLSHVSLKRILSWWIFLGDCSCLLLGEGKALRYLAEGI